MSWNMGETLQENTRLKQQNEGLEQKIKNILIPYDEFTAEIERLKCIIELNLNLTQQAQNEVDRLEVENEKLKEALQVLVDTKDKDKNGKDDKYNYCKGIAWNNARELLNEQK